ncbi:MAG: hypothetical protein FD118_1442 [Rhodocyclaceae bacterium]|nr:MAG: hypothetical protein FD118_1442 [Rhodocyclaceae bacterium]
MRPLPAFYVEDVAEALDGDVGLLEFLPQAHQAQQRLAHAAGEHLEGHQHADGEAVVLHHQQRPGEQDAQGHELFQAVGQRVVGVGHLLGAEAGGEILGEEAAIALFDMRFHLQRLDRGHAGNVFGEVGLVARAEQELLIEAFAEHRGDQHRNGGDQAHDADGDQGQLPRIPEHHGEEDQQEGEIQHQGDGGAGDEFADGLDALQAGDHGAGGALLEPGQGQAQQVAEDLAAEHGVDAVAGVQHQILPQPAHDGGEDHEHDQRHADHGQRAGALVRDHLVNDDLGEQRCGEADQLDGERGDQHVAPDAAVFGEFGEEPAEAEGRRFVAAVGVGDGCFLRRELQYLAAVAGGEVGQWLFARLLRARLQPGDAVIVAAQEEHEGQVGIRRVIRLIFRRGFHRGFRGNGKEGRAGELRQGRRRLRGQGDPEAQGLEGLD